MQQNTCWPRIEGRKLPEMEAKIPDLIMFLEYGKYTDAFWLIICKDNRDNEQSSIYAREHELEKTKRLIWEIGDQEVICIINLNEFWK